MNKKNVLSIIEDLNHAKGAIEDAKDALETLIGENEELETLVEHLESELEGAKQEIGRLS